MLNRKELKNNAKKSLKLNYFKSVVVLFIVGIILNSGYQYKTQVYEEFDKRINSTVQISNIYNIRQSNYNLIVDTLKKITNKVNDNTDDNNFHGFLSPIVNNITQSNSVILGFLNSINLFIFNKGISSAIISLVAALIALLFYIFIQNIIVVGKCRYFMEQRRYKETQVDKLLFPYKVKKVLHLSIILFLKKLYNFLWGLTIVGGVIKYYEYLMIPYILAENPSISKKDAFKLSKELMQGNKWNTFKLDLSLIGWNVLGILTIGISDIFYTNPYKECIYSEIYFYLRNNKTIELKKLLNDKYIDIKEVVDYPYPKEKFSIPIIQKEKKHNTNYIQDYKITDYIMMFFTFSFIGWIWEVFVTFLTEGKFVNRGTLLGPWLPIYGTGGLIFLIMLKPFRNKPLLLFLGSALLAGILEYSTSLYLEIVNHMKWWDYTGYFMNLNGRICLEGLLIFGLGGSVVTYFLAPTLKEIYSKINSKIILASCVIIVLLIGSDFIYSTINPNTGQGITYGDKY